MTHSEAEVSDSARKWLGELTGVSVESLPQWDAERCYELWLVHAAHAKDPMQRPPSKDEGNEFVQQLHLLVALYFGRNKLLTTLEEMGIGAADMAQEIVHHIYTRIDRYQLRGAGHRVMCAAVNTTCSRKCADAIGTAGRHAEADSEVIDRTVAPSVGADSVERLATMLNLPAARLAVVDGLEGDQAALEQLVEHHVQSLLKDNSLNRHDSLPSHLREKLSPEEHGLVTTRLIRAVRHYAAAGSN